ncbi:MULTISPECIES: MarR family winged helix-turn-helix transcriptional regulator [unclassified Mycolicibacterium]|jgi:DNA-binding MarR family transcriptional regulator|uniref:MarR family winged helix-turn-helix transcriptional regulator n=1 Tax=unclassified Mycolicibacterium TaxID=2636767 RepID=UPI00224A9D40|nr:MULTISPECIES: MarR family transcriptional regulator [unclassified Mycolicibacterium]MCX2710994.1 MarR family transcriptional regulator [Mycolicibacterium sp. J2]MDX1874130.1 MarR family transcriptional regulator [Mycolicibacterium sp. 120266]
MPQQEPPAQRIHPAMVKLIHQMSRPETRTKLLGDAGHDLTPVDVDLLRTIIARQPVRASHLSDAQAVDKSTITPQIRRLERRKLITRRTDPTDRRAVLLSATALGRETSHRMDSTGTEFIETALRHWPKKDQAMFATLFCRFVDDLADQPAH